MSLLDLFRTSAEKELAHSLAEHIAKNIPPKLLDQKRQLLSANKISRTLEQAYARAKDHQKQVQMGFARRAIFANSFKWELQSRGYPKDFVNLATEGLVVELSRAGDTESSC